MLAVVGAGSWGTALAILASVREPTLLWARDPALVEQCRAQRENPRYLPGIALPTPLSITDDMDEVASTLRHEPHPLIILGVPVAGMATACAQAASLLGSLPQGGSLVWTCKGLDDAGHLPHQIAASALAEHPKVSGGVLAGPSFAREVAQGLPVALTIASHDPALRQRVTQLFHGAVARIYGSEDLVGVEIGGALKNVIAIACGIADGLALGNNARAALITRGLAEITRLGLALGAQVATFSGLTGMGDLVLTATGDLSRNRRVGLALGQGQSLDAILADLPQVAEGVRCARAVLALSEQHGVDMPITAAVCRVLFDGLPARQAVIGLLARDPRDEPADPPAIAI